MDVNFELGDLKFVWDSDKEKINKKKHKISFETAAYIFLDENRIEYYDEIHSDFEDRIKLIGRIKEVLTVIYTERGEINRIVSARKATKDEEEEYYEQFYY